MKPNFIYKTYHPVHSALLYGDQMFLHTLIKDRVEFKHNFEGIDGAIVSVRGCDNMDYADQLNEDLAKLKWCIVIITGNENSTGFFRLIKHPNCKIWVQTPGGSDEADYFLPLGLMTDVSGIGSKYADKVFNWCFSGQVTHSRRYGCVRILESLRDGYLNKTEGFMQGLTFNDYFMLMQSCRVAPCPGGPSTPDTFRVAEALEAGCVPVLDMQSGNIQYQGDYWRKVFGPNHPFRTLENWEDMPRILGEILADWEAERDATQYWWAEFKQRVVNDLLKQVEELS